MKKDRPHWIDRGEPAATPEEARQRRSTGMITTGVLALVFAVALYVDVQAVTALIALLGLLGVGLLVGGLVIRR